MAGPPPLPAGIVLAGRYRIDRLLAQGGMSRIYLVFDERLSQNCLVAKELDPATFALHDQQDFIDLFAREAELLAPLRHPHIPRVLDKFDAAGKYYLVMDFVPGETYEDYLLRIGQIPISELLTVGATIAQVLDYLHTQPVPILHRDLKPANLIRQADGKVILLDFGIAKAIPPQLLGKTVMMTQKLGTPGYCPPEQYGAKTTPASDLFSLGATLHHLLSGIDPRTTFDQAPFQYADLTTLRADVPPALAALVTELVQLIPAQRPKSAKIVGQHLPAEDVFV